MSITAHHRIAARLLNNAEERPLTQMRTYRRNIAVAGTAWSTARRPYKPCGQQNPHIEPKEV